MMSFEHLRAVDKADMREALNANQSTNHPFTKLTFTKAGIRVKDKPLSTPPP
jgi:hypothetical protein